MENSPFASPSRRQVLAAAAATVTLPMLGSAIGALRAAQASATTAPATARGTTSAPAEKPGWFATTLKPADLKDKEFTAVAGHVIVLSRTDKTVVALTNKCTHKGCAINPKAGANILTCPCHGAQFNLDGTVAKAPAKLPLDHYAIRVSANGVIEIDPGQKLAKDDKSATITIS